MDAGGMVIVDDESAEFFRSIPRLVKDPDGEHLQAALDPHLEYLADKAGVTVTSVLAGDRFEVHQVVLYEAVVNMRTVIEQWAQQYKTFPEHDGLGSDVSRLVRLAISQLYGWCTEAKAVSLARIVLSERPTTCVEIGVFGGRSLVPCAAALRSLGHGHIYGVEAWNGATATEYHTSPENDDWWRSLDYVAIKRRFLEFLVEQDLVGQVRLIEAASRSAAEVFDTIDMLHIDGAHSVFNAAEDVVLYSKKVPVGGIIVLDDVNWATTSPAKEILRSVCETILVLPDDNGRPACEFYRKVRK